MARNRDEAAESLRHPMNRLAAEKQRSGVFCFGHSSKWRVTVTAEAAVGSYRVNSVGASARCRCKNGTACFLLTGLCRSFLFAGREAQASEINKLNF